MGWTENTVYEFYVPYVGEYEIRQVFPGFWEVRSVDHENNVLWSSWQFFLFRARAELKTKIYTDLLSSEAEMEGRIVDLKQEVIDQSEASFSDIAQQDGLGEKQQELRELENMQDGMREHMANLWQYGVRQYEATKL